MKVLANAIILTAAVSALSAFAADPIWWGCGDAKHQCSVRDDSAAPKGKLLSDNLHWYGPAVFTGCTYEYDSDLYWKDEINRILKEHGLGLREIQKVISTIDPLPGAREFLDALRARTQVILISDTFEQFAGPLMEKLGRPTLFCNTLDVAPDGSIAGYRLRVEKSKLATVRALQSIGFDTIASGDSFNDLAMIEASKAGFLFRSTEAIKAAHPELPAYEEYDDLLAAITAAF